MASKSHLELKTEQADTTKNKEQVSKMPEVENRKSTEKTSTAGSMAYNIIYYLISIFIKTNPLSRPG